MARVPLMSSIQSRLMLVVFLAMSFLLAGLGTISWLAVRESISRSLQERMTLAQTTAEYLGYVLSENLTLLGEVAFAEGVDMWDDNPAPEDRALHNLYITSIFDGGAYIVDASGKVLAAQPAWAAPPGTALDYPPVAKALAIGKPVISDVYILPGGQAGINGGSP